MSIEEVTTTTVQMKDWRPGEVHERLTWTQEDEVRFSQSNGRKPAKPTPRRGDPANKTFSWQR